MAKRGDVMANNMGKVVCLTWKRAVAGGLREMGSALGKGGEGGPSPPERGKDKLSVPNKGRDNMGEDEENHPSRT